MKHLELFWIHIILSFHSQVGFFPSECVELISEKIPSNVTSSLATPGTNLLPIILQNRESFFY